MPTSSGLYVTSKHGAETPIKNWSSLIGIVTAIVGNVLISFALNTQRYAHIRIDREYKFRHDLEAKKARRHLPKAIRNYGTAVRQEEAAEERARINAAASGPGEANTNGEEHPLLQDGETRRQSDDTLKPKEDDEGESDGRKSYLKSPWWWLGIVLMTVGEAGNFLAYGFAPASIVSPLGVVALVSNCLIAPLMLKERFRQRDFWGVVISVAGAVTVVLSANQNEEQLDPRKLWKDVKRWEFLVYVLITIILMGALMFASPKYGHRTILIDLGLVGLFGGYTALSTKGVASLLSANLYRAFTYPIFYFLVFILVLSAIMQIRYLNRALQKFDSTQVIPVQFVLFTLSVIIGSAILYQDFRRTNADHAVKFVVGCALTFSGVYLITSGRKLPDEDETDSIHEQDQIRLIDEEAAPVEDERTSLKRETERASFHDQSQDDPRTPRQHSRASSQAPSIVVTPADESPPSKGLSSGLNHNPWISSTEHLDHNEPERPKTPVSQSMPPAAESSETPFFTPSTTLHRPIGLHRTTSSPGSPQTPTRRAPSPPKPDSSARRSISRFIPGPLMPPLSSSLSGIIAESIRRGEGSPASIRAVAQRKKSLREAQRSGGQLDGDLPISAILAGSSSMQPHVSRTNSDRGGVPISQSRPMPQQTLSSTPGPVLSGSLGKTKGRLRSMSETLSGLMGKSRGKASGDSTPTATPRTNARNGSRDDDSNDDDDDTPDGRLT